MVARGADRPEWHGDVISREPVCDLPEFIWDEVSFDAEIAPDFAEIGDSGAWYSREEVRRVVLCRLAGTHPISLAGSQLAWVAFRCGSHHGLRSRHGRHE